MNSDFRKVEVIYENGKHVFPIGWYSVGKIFPKFIHPEKAYAGSFFRMSMNDTINGIVGLNILNPTEGIYTGLIPNLIKDKLYQIDVDIKIEKLRFDTASDLASKLDSNIVVSLVTSFCALKPNCDTTFNKSLVLLEFPMDFSSDSNQWITISTTYMAKGDEKYYFIGDCNTATYVKNLKSLKLNPIDFRNKFAYYFIKKVKIEPWTKKNGSPPKAKKSSQIDLESLNTIVKIYSGVQFMFDSIVFKPNSYLLNDTIKPLLNKLAEFLKKDNIGVKFTDQTDSSGLYDYNWALFDHRIQVISRYLISQGVNKDNFIWDAPTTTNAKGWRTKNSKKWMERNVGFELFK